MAKKAIRPIRIEGNVAYVQLTQGYEAIIDAADVHLVEGVNWQATVKGYTVYACRTWRGSGGKGIVFLHRVVLPTAVDQMVDHADGNGLNNRRANLRHASRSQNACNQKKRRDNTSGFKGVVRSKKTGRFQATIRTSGKRKSLGFYACPTAAYFAYVKAAREVYGDFSRLA